MTTDINNETQTHIKLEEFKHYKQNIADWALVFRNNLIDIPNVIEIHSDFLNESSKEEFENTFRFLWSLFYKIYSDVSNNPLEFGYSAEESKIKVTAADSGVIFRHMQQLYLIFKNGKLVENGLNGNLENIKKTHIKVINSLIPVWTAYGFDFEGLTDGKITSKTIDFFIYYPDNPLVIKVLYFVAKKAIYEFLFKQWNYRLLVEALDTFSYKDNYIGFHDLLHSNEEREFIQAFHKAMLEHGYFIESYPGRGQGHISYFYKTNKDPYYFDVRTYGKFGMYVSLRIRNIEKCFPYLDECSERIKNNFSTSVLGCGNTACNIKASYIFEGKKIEKCCVCCGTAWEFKAHIDDIFHYIKLVELSVEK